MNGRTLDADDLARGVAHLDDETILRMLHDRYDEKAIYSSVNRMLIAINPYEDLGLYSAAMLETYAALGGESAPPPHAYAVASAAFKGLLAGGSQSIVITGESGAGKTETAKRMMQFLAHMAGAHVGERAGAEAHGAALDAKSPAALHHHLLRTNALMEAWGNARTTMNDNSSRFGKFLSVQYDSSAKLLGAQINTYLLEKTRVVQRGAGECSFHIFYMLLLGLPPSEAGQLELMPDVQSFRYARLVDADIDPAGRDGEGWAEQLAEVRGVLTDTIGIPAADVWSTLSLLAAVLHCGNIDFAVPAKGGTSAAAALHTGAMRPLKALARLLGVDAAELCDALTTRVIRAGAEWVTKPNTTAEACGLADALAKALYARLFDRIVASINGAVGLARPGAPTGGGLAHSFIGILDIFGFEHFGTNSLEQLLINYTNEQLQSLFNGIVFSAAQAEAELEGVSTAAFGEGEVDNREVLHLFSAERTGLIATLNEECIFPKASDETFVAKLKRANARNARLVDDSSNARADHKMAFTVRHFAGDVTYAAAGFLLKNKDPFSEDIAVLLRESSEPLVAALFAPPTVEKTSARRAGTFQRLVFKGVAPQFDAQLQRLHRVLGAGSVHFVRCVKPNGDKRPRAFDDERVLTQLRCGGVMEAVRVFAAGFPDRVPFDSVCARYAPLARMAAKPASADAAAALLGALGVGANQYALGHSKVFFKSGVVAQLERRREQLLAHNALKCQAAVRGMLASRDARARLAASREAKERRHVADESALLLAEMEASSAAEREREAASTASVTAAARAAAAEAAMAIAAQAAATRAADDARLADAIASKQRAAALELELERAKAQLLTLRMAAGGVPTTATAGASTAVVTPAAAGALDEAIAAAKAAGAEAAALREQLSKAEAELAREKGTAAKLRAEAESTNLKWQTEARRANAELRRQTNLREAERRAHADKKDEMAAERDYWKGETQRRWMRDVEDREANAKPGRRSGVEKVADMARGAAAVLFGAGTSRGGDFTPVVPDGRAAGTRARRNVRHEVNPSCRTPSAPAAAAPAGARGTAGGAMLGARGGAAGARAPAGAPPRARKYLAETYGGKWDAEVLEYAEYMEIDPVDDEAIMWIAEDLREAQLPVGWVKQRDPSGGLYFFNETTHESMLKHPQDLQYRQLIDEFKLERAMTGAPPPPAASFGTMTIRSMADSLFVVPGAQTLVSARLAVPGARGGVGGAGAPASLLPEYVLHMLLVPDRSAESVPVLRGSCLQHDASTTFFPLSREPEGDDFACVVAHNCCSRSTLYVADEAAGEGEREMSALIVREPYPGAKYASVDVVLPMPRADGTAVGVPVKRRVGTLLSQYEAKHKGSLVVLCGQLRADSRALELTLSLPSRPGAASSNGAYMMHLRQPAGGADMELRYRDRVSPVQAMHVALALSRWWSMRQPARGLA